MSMQRRAAAFLTRALVKARLASLGSNSCGEVGPGGTFHCGGSPAFGVTTTKPRAEPFSSSWLTTAWATSFEDAPWKLRMSGSGRFPVGSDGTANRYWRGTPATSSISVVVPATAGDPQPDDRPAGAGSASAAGTTRAGIASATAGLRIATTTQRRRASRHDWGVRIANALDWVGTARDSMRPNSEAPRHP